MDGGNVQSCRALTRLRNHALGEFCAHPSSVEAGVCPHTLPMVGSQMKTTDPHCRISLFLVSNKADMFCVFIAYLRLNHLFVLFTQHFRTRTCTIF